MSFQLQSSPIIGVAEDSVHLKYTPNGKEKHPTAVSNLKRSLFVCTHHISILTFITKAVLLHDQILAKYEQEIINCKMLREDNIKLINRINLLEQANIQKENEIKKVIEETLKQQMSSMEKQLSIQQTSLSERDEEIQQLKHQMNYLDHLLDIERKKYNELRAHSDELYQKYIDREIAIKEAEIKYIKVSDDLFSVREELDLTSYKLKQKQIENEKMKSTYLKLNTDCETVKIEIEDVQSKYDSLSQKHQESQNQLLQKEKHVCCVVF